MLRAIELGKKALGSAAPNPRVGCVIVHNANIIGEGFTSAYGGPHAEVNAIASVKDKTLLEKATLYVTLEPCSHHGKTPPCADLILAYKIPKVVIGLRDPNPKVAGKGIKKLKKNGCEVITAILEKKCREHHRRFLTFQEQNRPYIILKWAETSDGFIAPDPKHRTKNPEPYWITNSHSQQLVHQWRGEEMAILVGTNTVLQDNPKLDVRHWAGKPPMRIVLDRDLKIPNKFHVLDGSIKTFVLTEKKKESAKENLIFATVTFDGNLTEHICTLLHEHNIASVLIEGGAKTLQTFIDNQLWDEARIFKSDVVFNSGVKAPVLSGNPIRQVQIENDALIFMKNG